jgi:hypothetical protein
MCKQSEECMSASLFLHVCAAPLRRDLAQLLVIVLLADVLEEILIMSWQQFLGQHRK